MTVHGQRALAGNGVALVRELELATRIQRALERLYRLDPIVDLESFVIGAEEGEREALFVRESSDGALELALRLPSLSDGADVDVICQIIEGVSHFVYVSHRAATRKPSTQLELELQAEVDKYVVLLASMDAPDEGKSAHLRRRLYEGASYVHDESSEEGHRYRLASASAMRFTRRLERELVASARYGELQRELRRFWWMSQEEKLRAHSAER